MKVFTFDFVPYGKDLTGRLKYPVGRENYESEIAAKTYENHAPTAWTTHPTFFWHTLQPRRNASSSPWRGICCRYTAIHCA